MFSLKEQENLFQGNLNPPGRGGSRGQPARHRIWESCSIKNVRVRWRGGRSKVWMIENVEYLRTELNVESLRDTLDVIVLKQREVQRGDAWANQDVAPCIAAKVEAWIRW